MEGGISFDLWGQALITSMHMSICFCAFEYFSIIMCSITVSLGFIFYFVSIFVPELCFFYFLWFVVQLFSRVWLFASPWTAECQASLSFTISWSLLKLMSVESVMPFNDLVLCCPLLLPSIFPSIRDFSNESIVCIRWPKYWSFSFSPSSEYSGLISFRIDCDWLFVTPRTVAHQAPLSMEFSSQEYWSG